MLRVIALLAAYNEERFIGNCLAHFARQGVMSYLIDNGSTDRTVAIAESYLGRGLIGIEQFPRDGLYRWQSLLERKEHLASSLDADWFIHADPDEVRLPPPGRTLVEALAEVDAQGYNAVNFLEFTFTPTQESPDHDHADYQTTMRWYYPFLPAFPHQVKAWRRQSMQVELAWSGGHLVRFPGLRMAPESFPMRHYPYLSVPHAIAKYVDRHYDPRELACGWHIDRQALRRESITIRLPRQVEMRHYEGDDRLDPSSPRVKHFLFDQERGE